MKLYLLRHGSTDWNKLMLLQGQTDIPLNEDGINAARKCGEEMANIPFHKIYTSTLKRAYKTAELIRGSRNIPIVKDERIIEACFGELEGIDISRIPDGHLQGAYTAFFQDPANYKPVNGGEPFENLVDRASSFLEEIVAKEPSDSHILVVAHGAVIKALQVKPFHRSIGEFWAGGVPANCTACVIEYNDGKYTLISQGDTVEYKKPR